MNVSDLSSASFLNLTAGQEEFFDCIERFDDTPTSGGELVLQLLQDDDLVFEATNFVKPMSDVTCEQAVAGPPRVFDKDYLLGRMCVSCSAPSPSIITGLQRAQTHGLFLGCKNECETNRLVNNGRPIFTKKHVTHGETDTMRDLELGNKMQNAPKQTANTPTRPRASSFSAAHEQSRGQPGGKCLKRKHSSLTRKQLSKQGAFSGNSCVLETIVEEQMEPGKELGALKTLLSFPCLGHARKIGRWANRSLTDYIRIKTDLICQEADLSQMMLLKWWCTWILSGVSAISENSEHHSEPTSTANLDNIWGTEPCDNLDVSEQPTTSINSQLLGGTSSIGDINPRLRKFNQQLEDVAAEGILSENYRIEALGTLSPWDLLQKFGLTEMKLGELKDDDLELFVQAANVQITCLTRFLLRTNLIIQSMECASGEAKLASTEAFEATLMASKLSKGSASEHDQLGNAAYKIAALLQDDCSAQCETTIALRKWSAAAAWLDGYTTIFTRLFMTKRVRVSNKEVPKVSFVNQGMGGTVPTPLVTKETDSALEQGKKGSNLKQGNEQNMSSQGGGVARDEMGHSTLLQHQPGPDGGLGQPGGKQNAPVGKPRPRRDRGGGAQASREPSTVSIASSSSSHSRDTSSQHSTQSQGYLPSNTKRSRVAYPNEFPSSHLRVGFGLGCANTGVRIEVGQAERQMETDTMTGVQGN